jgi:hypothetical protein
LPSDHPATCTISKVRSNEVVPADVAPTELARTGFNADRLTAIAVVLIAFGVFFWSMSIPIYAVASRRRRGTSRRR